MVLRIAHRGASRHVLENSMLAFKQALILKADVVEFDVRLTRDKKIVVVHDSDLKRTMGYTRIVRELTLKQLKMIRSSNGETIPTIQEALDFLRGKCICKIDVKERNMEYRAVRMIKKYNIENSVIITSQMHDVVRKIKQRCPRIEVEAGGFEVRVPVEKIIETAKRARADIIGPHHTITTWELVQDAHKNGLKVHVWPVNDKKNIERMKRLGVDGITTSCPDKV